MESALAAALVFLGATVVSAALVGPSRVLARYLGVLDPPGERKVHTVPMPRLGGIAVFVSFIGIVLAGYLVLPSLDGLPWFQSRFGSSLALLKEAHRVEVKLLALIGGSTLAFVVGLLDDMVGRSFPVWAKALGQVAAAVMVIAADVRTSLFPSEWMNVVITLVWITGITNSFNLLDNMDGLSAGVAFVASAVLLINAWSLGEFFISLMLVAFMGSLLGFLFFNFHPSSVFLGDCGSLFIGYVMANLTLLERYVSHASSTLFPVLMPLVVLAIPILDTATVVFIRIRERRPIYVGDSRHLSHRMLSLGFSQRASALFIYLATFSLGLGAANLTDANPGQSFTILLQSVGVVALILILLFFERRKQPRRMDR